MIKDIPNHSGFKATDDGQIIGKRGKPLIGHVDKSGYREVLLSENGKTTQHRVHRLIAETFIPNIDKLECVNHIDGNKLNNNVNNLEWRTHSDNTKHSYRNGLQTKVTNPHGTFKVLTQDELQTIKKLHKLGLIDSEIADHVGCSRGLVSRKIREMGLR